MGPAENQISLDFCEGLPRLTSLDHRPVLLPYSPVELLPEKCDKLDAYRRMFRESSVGVRSVTNLDCGQDATESHMTSLVPWRMQEATMVSAAIHPGQ